MKANISVKNAIQDFLKRLQMKDKEQTPEEKKETMMTGIFLVVSIIVTYFFYKWFVVDLFVPLFGIGTIGKIVISIIVFFICFGTMFQAYNKSQFYETHKYGLKIKK